MTKRKKTRNEIRQLQRAALEDLAIGSLAGHVRVLWHILEPGTYLEWNWHHQLICDELERVLEGRVTDLVICIPPGAMKSLLTSVFFTTYAWLKYPEKRFLCLSAVQTVVNRDAEKMLAIIRSDLYKRLMLRYDQQKAKSRGISRTLEQSRKAMWRLERDGLQRAVNSKKGERLSFTMGANFTGPRADGWIVDDPVDVATILFGSPQRINERLEETVRVMSKKLSSRLNDKRGCVRSDGYGIVKDVYNGKDGKDRVVVEYGTHKEEHVIPVGRKLFVEVGDAVSKNEPLCSGGYFKILIMQRLHPHDPAAWMLDNTTDVEHIILPQEFNPDSPYVHPKDPRTRHGELLHPSMVDRKTVETAKSPLELGPVQFEGQHNQNPMGASGGQFTKDLFDGITYPGSPFHVVHEMSDVAISVDCANKNNERACESSIQVWGRHKVTGKEHLIYLYAGRWEYIELQDAFKTACTEWPMAHTKYIEDQGNGITLIQNMKRVMKGIIAVQPRRAVDKDHPLNLGKTRSKADRAAFTKLCLRSRDVRLPSERYVPLVAVWKAQHIEFGSGGADDYVDATSQYLERAVCLGATETPEQKRERWQSTLGGF